MESEMIENTKHQEDLANERKLLENMQTKLQREHRDHVKNVKDTLMQTIKKKNTLGTKKETPDEESLEQSEAKIEGLDVAIQYKIEHKASDLRNAPKLSSLKQRIDCIENEEIKADLMNNVFTKVSKALVAKTMKEKDLSQEQVTVSKELTINKLDSGMGLILKKAFKKHTLYETNYGIYNENQTVTTIRNLI